MSRSAFKPASRFAALAASSSLAFALSLTVSHQAMAACAPPVGGTIVCTDVSTIQSDHSVDFSTTNLGATSDGGMAVKVQATNDPNVDDDGIANITNTKDISASVTTPHTTSNNSGNNLGVYGMKGRDAFGIEEWTLTNSGNISATHNGVGEAAAVALQDDAEAWTINNSGTLVVTRGAISVTAFNQNTGALSATPDTNPDSVAASALRVAAAIYHNEEEVRDFNVTNEEEAKILANGQYAAAIFTRANSFELKNEGEIAADDPTGAAIVTWDGRLLKNFPDAEVTDCNSVGAGHKACTGREFGFGKSFIENEEKGTISGNIILSSQNGLQTMGALGQGVDPVTLNGTATDGLSTNQGGTNVAGGLVERRDSEFTNEGTIVGNFYLGQGSHTFVNEGDVGTDSSRTTYVVDQRRVTNYVDGGNVSASSSAHNSHPYQLYVAGRGAAFEEEEEAGEEDEEGGKPEIYTSDNGLTYAAAAANAVSKLLEENPDHYFEFENAGTFKGDVFVLTNNYYAAASALETPHEVVLKPHITGSGADSEEDDPSTESGFIDGTLAIGKGTMAGWTVTMSESLISDEEAAGKTKTTIEPVIDHVVHSGEWFLVAKELYGDDLPGIEEESYLVEWDVRKNINKSLVIGSTVADASTVPNLSRPGIAALNNLLSTDGDDDDLNDLAVGVLNLEKGEDVRKAGEQLAPETNFATQEVAKTLAFLTGQYIDNRLSGSGATGSSGGGGFSPPSGLGMKQEAPAGRMNAGAYGGVDDGDAAPFYGKVGGWGQAFGSGLNQDEAEHVDGYDATIYGLLAGYDNWLSPGFRFGAALGYANTNIDGQGDTIGNKTDIESYLGLLYASLKGSGWYLTGRTGYTFHDYDTRRQLTVPVKDVASGSHDGDQYVAAAEGGIPLRTAGATLTPVASFTYSHLEQDAYTETSGGGMALDVASQENDSFVTGLGVKALVPIAVGTFFEGRAIWLHEFGDTAQDVTASFAAGGAAFAAAGPDTGRDTAAIGAGLFAYAGGGVNFQLNYDALLREEFVAHAGSARFRFEY